VGARRFRLNDILKRKSSLPALVPRSVGPDSTTPAACLCQPGGQVGRTCCNIGGGHAEYKHQSKPYKETRRTSKKIVLPDASATVISAWSRATSSCRILSRQTNSWRCALVAPHTLRPSPHTIRARRLYHYSNDAQASSAMSPYDARSSCLTLLQALKTNNSSWTNCHFTSFSVKVRDTAI